MAVSSRYEVFSFKLWRTVADGCAATVWNILLHNPAPPGLSMVVSPRYEAFSFKIWRPLVLVWLCRHAMKSSPSQSGAPWSYGCAATVWTLLHNLVPPGLMAVPPQYGVFSTIYIYSAPPGPMALPLRYGIFSFTVQRNWVQYPTRPDVRYRSYTDSLSSR